MENPIKMDDLGGKPTIFGNTLKHDGLKMILSFRDGLFSGDMLNFQGVTPRAIHTYI